MLSRRRVLVALFLMVLVSLGHAVSTFAVDFADPVSYPVGTAATGLVVADFNGDGKLDLALSNSGDGNVSILLGRGDGTLQAAVNFDAGVANPASLAMGDFNDDGKLDLAALDISLGALSILLGNGDGSFQATKTLALAFAPRAMVVTDFNLDGKSDLAVSGPDPRTNAATINVFLGNGDGTFQPAKQTSGVRLERLAAADFNSDGKPDLAASSGDSVNIFLGNGDGTFQQGTIVAVGGEVFDFRVADVNNDSKVDLVVGSGRVTGTGTCAQVCVLDTDISLFLGSGSGLFGGRLIIANASAEFRAPNLEPHSGSRIIGMFWGDFNGDEQLDVGYWRLHSSFTSLEGRLGKGDGAFSPVLGFGPGLRVAAVADLNSDKNGDLVVSEGDDKISVALNTSPTAGADLGIISAGADANPAGVGTTLTYTADVLNEGPKEATEVTFTDTLPNSVNFVSAAITQGSCIQSRGIVTCSVGSLADAFDSQVTIVVTPTTTGTITNTMSVTATEPDLASANNIATQATTVQPSFMLAVTKAGSSGGAVTSVPGGIDCGSTCSAAFLSGTVVTLSATPSNNSAFAGWSGACTGTGSCTITVNADQTVTATFNPPPDFTMSPTATSLTMKRGGQVSDVLTFQAQGGFSGTIALACSVSGPSPMPTCSISPASVTPGTNATLTVNAAALAAVLTPSLTFERTGGGLYASLLPLGMLGCVLVSSFDKKRRRMWALCLLLLVVTIIPAACGGGGSTSGPPPQTNTVTVTATSGALQHSTQVIVTVN